MSDLTNAEQPNKSFLNIFLMFMCIGIGAVNSECASSPIISKPDGSKPERFVIKMEGDPAISKSIFVFLDGTANDAKSGTNVWLLFNQLEQYKNQQTTGRYIEGVGNVDGPLEDDPLLPIFGDALGMGMQARILEGYDFIAQNYKPGDEIFIFGFSRGAHQARALAGILAYAGIPTKVFENNDERKRKLENILKLVKDKYDKDYEDQWKAWKPNHPPFLANEIKNHKDIELDMQAAEIKLLGIWDTVPGSSFKDYGECKESIGFWKTYFHWLPVISKGERYKSDSYPAIRNIAHAVALDEKRSKFAPLLLCPAINRDYSAQSEMWFPGAHADVGGGYDDSNELPGISLNWMIGLLSESYKFNTIPPKVKENTKGLAHWSIGDHPANLGSECEDRHPPQDSQIHKSVYDREQSSPVPIRIGKNIESLKYPKLCPGE